MSTAEKIEKLITQFFKTKKSSAVMPVEKDKQILDNALTAFEKSKMNTPEESSPGVWRIIMKSSITKLAIAAVLVIAAIVPIIFLNKTTQPAYALEQTIEAMKSTRIVHILCRDWQGNNVEIWMKLNPETRLSDYMYLEYPLHGLTALTTPENSYQYFKKGRVFQISQKPLLQFDLRLENIFEDLAAKIAAEKDYHNSQMSIHKHVDPNTGKDLLVITAQSNETDIEILVDPETKLPMSMHIISTKILGNFIKDFDEIFFDQEPPAGLFDFVIPENVLVVDMDKTDKLEDDPNCGITVDNMSKQDAAELLAKIQQKYKN
jgi:hypothetical protein